jgi:hypothetical protein
MSKFTAFLSGAYAKHFGYDKAFHPISIRQTVPASIRFEIEDKQPKIIQPAGKGVSVIRRQDTETEVVDLEAFTALIHGSDHTPPSCDFALSPTVGTSFLILNELTRTNSAYISRFIQPHTGVSQRGKLETAKEQLTATINRLYEGMVGTKMS